MVEEVVVSISKDKVDRITLVSNQRWRQKTSVHRGSVGRGNTTEDVNDIGGEELRVRQSKGKNQDRFDSVAQLVNAHLMDICSHMIASVHPEKV